MRTHKFKANTNNYEPSSRRYICKCKYSMTHTNVSENDYTETEQSVMNWDETTFVKRTLVHGQCILPESYCDCESEQ